MANCGTLVVESDTGGGGGDDGSGGNGGGGGGEQPSQPVIPGLEPIRQWAQQNPRLAAGVGLVGGLAAYSVVRGDTRQPTLPPPRTIARRGR